MQLIPIKTGRIQAGDDLVSALLQAINKERGTSSPSTRLRESESRDLLVISSKAVATAEGRVINLRAIDVSKDAEKISIQCGRSLEFSQAVLDETSFRNGKILSTCPGAILTELKPKGLKEGTIVIANAGLDESNSPEGSAIGWPEEPLVSARKLRKELGTAIILSDSCVRPRRWGVTAFALAASGIDPLHDQTGRKDLFGKTLRITKEATADQLATAANMLMGNADQSIPAVLIRDHGFPLSNFEGWVPGIEAEEDLFRKVV